VSGRHASYLSIIFSVLPLNSIYSMTAVEASGLRKVKKSNPTLPLSKLRVVTSVTGSCPFLKSFTLSSIISFALRAYPKSHMAWSKYQPDISTWLYCIYFYFMV